MYVSPAVYDDVFLNGELRGQYCNNILFLLNIF